jgi:hypothetical protein
MLEMLKPTEADHSKALEMIYASEGGRDPDMGGDRSHADIRGSGGTVR